MDFKQQNMISVENMKGESKDPVAIQVREVIVTCWPIRTGIDFFHIRCNSSNFNQRLYQKKKIKVEININLS